ncbi:hypothetical protein BKA63DRAFT_223922 [Paraphoma chrysanthemicola]|nr:hypothetical protein BKA63DRAFT_223922 [Paraphoma chrysanthemicola]
MLFVLVIIDRSASPWRRLTTLASARSDLRGSTTNVSLLSSSFEYTPQSNRDSLEAAMKYFIEELAPDGQQQPGLRSWRLRCSWADGPMELEFAGYNTDLELFRWYVEKYATRDPLSAKKASGVEESLIKYREKICSLLRVGSFENHGSLVVLDIIDNGDKSDFHSLPWEFLEHGSQAQRVVVRRRTKATKDPLLDGKIQHQPETFNILLLAARSDDNDQAEYSQAALPIVELLQCLPAGSSTITLDKGVQSFHDEDKSQKKWKMWALSTSENYLKAIQSKSTSDTIQWHSDRPFRELECFHSSSDATDSSPT